MINSLIVEGKIIGYKKPILPQIAVPLPPEVVTSGEGLTLKKLLELLVRHEVQAFRSRQEANLLTQVLTPKQIKEGATQGKIISGQQDLRQDVSEEVAVGTAWQSFEDGLFLAFLNGKQYTRLDEPVALQPESKLTLIRLIPLAGG